MGIEKAASTTAAPDLRAVGLVKRMGTGRTSESKHGIGILVDGAYIVIKDHYHRPAHEIAACLREYWNGGRPA